MISAAWTGLDAPWATVKTLSNYSSQQDRGDSARDHSDAFPSKMITDDTDSVVIREAIHDTIPAHPVHAARSPCSFSARGFAPGKADGHNLASADPLQSSALPALQGAF
jgi:hypothetical protein